MADSAGTGAGAASSPAFPYETVIRVKMASAAHAAMAAQTLAVDEELHKDKSEKLMSSEGDEVVATIRASEPRTLRVAVKSVYDMLGVVVRTLREFG